MPLLKEEIANENEFWKGLTEFCNSLASIIDDIPNTSPILLSGDWGSGKSSVLNRLKDIHEIKGDRDNSKVFIEFESWRYEQEDSLLPCLIRQIWVQKPDVDDEIKSLFIKVAAVATVLTTRAASTIPILGVEGLLKGLTIDKLIEEYSCSTELFTKEPLRSVAETLIDDFHTLLGNLYPNRTLVILIDDLDRCSPESALVLLDNIRMLINGLYGVKSKLKDKHNCSVKFIVAMDQVTVTEIVANKFTGLDSYEANRYLEKLFPFIFKLPAIKQKNLADFVVRNIEELDSDRRYFTTTQQVSVVDALIYKSFLNPRLIKRCLNRIYLFLKFTELSEDDLETKDFSTLYLWIPATERWPSFRRLLLRKPFSFWNDLQLEVKEKKQIQDEDARALMLQKGFKEFFKDYMRDDIHRAIKKFGAAEERLHEYGL